MFFFYFIFKRNKNQLIVHLTRQVEIKKYKENVLKKNLRINEIIRNTLQHNNERKLNNAKEEILRD